MRKVKIPQRSKSSSVASSLLQREWLVVSLLMLLALLLRLTNISATSFWIDELYTFMVANGRLQPDTLPQTILPASEWVSRYIAWQPLQWQTLLEALKINVHMPLYYVLLNPWLHWFGTHEAGLRSFSAVVSTLMLIPLYGLGKSLANGSRRAGVWVAVVAALVPFQIYYGQEGRMYALAMLWTCWACFSLWKTLYSQQPFRWSMVYALSLLLGFFTHYMFAFIVAFHLLYILLWLIRCTPDEGGGRSRIRFLCLPYLALGVALWFWLPIYRIQHNGLNEEYHFAKSLVKWHRYVSLPLWQPMVMIAGSNNLERVFYFPLLIGLFLFQLARLKNGAARLVKPRHGLFLALWIFAPLLLQIAYDFLNKTHISVMDRYVLLISPAMVLWMGLTLAQLFSSREDSQNAATSVDRQSVLKLNRFRAHKIGEKMVVGMMLIMAVLCVWSPSPFRDEHNKTKDIRRNVDFIVRRSRPQDLVMVNGPWGSNLITTYYLNQRQPQAPVLFWMSPYRHKDYPLPSRTVLQAYNRVWLFTYRSTNERGLEQIKTYLKTQYPHEKESVVWTLYGR